MWFMLPTISLVIVMMFQIIIPTEWLFLIPFFIGAYIDIQMNKYQLEKERYNNMSSEERKMYNRQITLENITK